MSGEHGLPELEARPQSRREWSGYLRSLVLPLGLVVAIVAGLLYLQSSHADSTGDGFGSVELPAARNSTGKPASAEEGRAAPDFYLSTLDGETVRLSDLQGKPVLVNFWASWCSPCRSEMPRLIDSYEANKTDGLVLLAINLREADERVAGFADEFGLPFPVLKDRRGEVARTWHIGGPMQGLPSSYFIDRNGVVQKVVLGAVTERSLADGLKLILGTSN